MLAHGAVHLSPRLFCLFDVLPLHLFPLCAPPHLLYASDLTTFRPLAHLNPRTQLNRKTKYGSLVYCTKVTCHKRQQGSPDPNLSFRASACITTHRLSYAMLARSPEQAQSMCHCIHASHCRCELVSMCVCSLNPG